MPDFQVHASVDTVPPLAAAADSGLPPLLAVPDGRKQLATRTFFGAALALMAVTASAWHPVAAAVMLILGYTLVRFAITGRAWTALYLTGHKKHQLVTGGPYSMCRNPLYFFTFVGLLGIGLAAGSLSIATLIAAWFALYYPLVIRKEEAKLEALHGEVFIAYRQSTPAFFPRFGLLREAAVYSVQPAKIRANTKDYVWMIWGLGLVQLFALLHQAGLLPLLVRIY